MNQKTVKRIRKMLKAQYPNEGQTDKAYQKDIHKLAKENKTLIRRHLVGLNVKQVVPRRRHIGFPKGVVPRIVFKRGNVARARVLCKL